MTEAGDAPRGGPGLRAFELPLAGPSLIAASAGTGKTYTIGSLLLRLLLEDEAADRPTPGIHELLVVTFTTAATAELRQRLRQRLAAALSHVEGRPLAGQDPALLSWLDGCAARDPAACRARLRAALRDFDDAAIFTIHGFCQRILKEYAFESGVDFDTELVGDESELRRTAMLDYWARTTYAAPALAVAWLQGPGGLGVEALVALGTALASAPTLPRVPAGVDSPPAPDADDLARLERDYRAAWSRAADAWRRGGPAALALVAEAAERGALNRTRYPPDKVSGRWPEQLAALFTDRPDWVADEERQKLQKLAAGRFGTNKNQPAPEHPFFDACADLVDVLDAAADELAAWGLALRHGLDAWLAQELPQRKRRARQQSFDDLLLRLRDALCRDDAQALRLAGRIRGRFRAALIDEFQDTDQVQYEIFQRVFAPTGAAAHAAGDGERPFLLIGDPKQAIYAFRGADVFAYLGAAADVGAARSHTLVHNHRSDPALLAALSSLWRPVPRPFLFGAIPFVEVQARHEDRLRPQLPALTLAYIPARVASPWAGAGKPAGVVPARRAVARAAATAIRQLLAAPPGLQRDDGRLRPVTAADVAVLVRSNAQARQMQRVLRDHGIPSVLYSEASVLDQPEADELRQILAAVVDPADARLVRAALVTAPLGRTAADLDRLAQDEREWEDWIERFRACQDTWRRAGFLPALRQLLDQTGAPVALLALADGERRLTNLLHLAELLHGVAFQLDLGPEGLLAWFDRVREDAELRRQVLGDTAQLRLDSDAEAVRIATIHKAKGLEYPIVFCPYLWSGRLPGASAPLRYHDFEAGRGQLLAIGPEVGEAARLATRLEELSENLRLLYVAMTRAKHALWLACGAFNDTASGALAYLLYARDLTESQPPDDDPAALEAWRRLVEAAAKAELSAAAQAEDRPGDPLWRRLEALAAANPRCIAARCLTRADIPGRATAAIASDEQASAPARSATHTPRRVLFRSSFTALARGQRDVEVAVDEVRDLDTLAVSGDTADTDPVAPRASADAERVPLADLVAGTRLGTGLHSLLERIDFRTSEDWQARAEALAARRALPAEAVAPLVAALEAVLYTPLGAGELAFSLSEIPRRDRIDEMGYVLPVAVAGAGGRIVPDHGSWTGADGGAPVVGPQELAAVLAAHPGGALPGDYPSRLAALPARAFAGWLNGALDLVFRRPGADGAPRWFLVDWKSNRLGATWDDYTSERLVAEMARHHYFLQAHLYTLALQRHLARHLGAEFDYERHFGGVLYVFVRGMRRDRVGSGVLFDRPPAARIAALDALLRQGARQ